MNFGIIGLGQIAKKFATGIKYVDNASLYAVAARSLEKAEAFKKEYNANVAYGSYEELLNDPNVDTVYLALPHPFHYEMALKVIDKKKNLICEKPMCLHSYETKDLVEKAEKANIYFAEGFMYRSHPQTHKIIEIIKSGILGEITDIITSFGYNFMDMEVPPERIYKKELAGGGIYDLGCYTISFVLYIIRNIFNEYVMPDKFYAIGDLNEDDIDMHTKAIMQFGKITTYVSTSINCMQPFDAFIYGTKGYLHIKDPYTMVDSKNALEVVIGLYGDKTTNIDIDAKYLYSYEIEIAVNAKGNENPYMTHQDSINTSILVDKWIEEIHK